MGIGYALLEEMHIDRGQVFNASFEDYKIPTACDLPQNIETLFVEKPHPEGPFGAKGMAEPAIAPTAAAIANAIFDAIGIRIKEVPLKPERVLEVLNKMMKARA